MTGFPATRLWRAERRLLGFCPARFTALCRRGQAGGNRKPVERLSRRRPITPTAPLEQPEKTPGTFYLTNRDTLSGRNGVAPIVSKCPFACPANV